MKYNKEHIKANGRKLVGGGPRDHQRRQQQADLGNIDHTETIQELKNEIKRLSTELHERPVIGGFTGEQVDKEIRDAVTEALADIKKEMKESAEREKTLSEELKSRDAELRKTKDQHSKELADLLKEHSRKLEELTTSLLAIGNNRQPVETINDDRPKMESVFIDPLEKDSGKNLESHVSVKTMSTDEENTLDKVNRLKGMLGRLPTTK